MQKYSLVSLVSLLALVACGDEADSIGAAEAGGGTGATTSSGDDESTGEGGSQDGGADATTSVTGADESSGGSEATAGTDICQEQTFDLALTSQAAQVMLVLDKSGSMTAMWDHDDNPQTSLVTRWSSLYYVVDSLTAAFADTFEFGAQLFPAYGAYLDEPANAHSCLMSPVPEVSVGPDKVQAIMAALPPPHDTDLSGGTPATAALVQAVAHLKTLSPDAATKRNQAIILITDGAANCDPGVPAEQTLFTYDSRLVDVVADAFEQDNISTYVVGIAIEDRMGSKPAVNTFESLTELALLGGAPKSQEEPFYNAQNEVELTTALETITAKVECTMTFPSEPYDPEKVRLTIGATEYGRLQSCNSGSGWAYTSMNGPYQSIELCGEACEAFQAAQSVQVAFYCD